MKNYRIQLHLALAAAIAFAPALSFGTTETIQSDSLKLGRKNSNAKELVFEMNQGAANPRLKTNASTGKLQFSNDGSVFKDIGSGSGAGAGINLVANSGFEDGINANFTNSGGTYTQATSGSNLLFDLSSAVFTASASGQYVRTALFTVPQGLAYRPFVGEIWYKGGDANYTLQVLDASSNVIASRVLETATDARPFAVPFNAGAAGSQYRIQVISTAAGAAVALDRFHGGEMGIRDLSQAALAGRIVYAATTNCDWTTTSTSYANYSADADCPTPTAYGAASAPATKIPGITFSSLPAGEYFLVASGGFRQTGVGSSDVAFRFSDGTNSTGGGRVAATQYSSSATIVGHLSYSATQTNITIQMQGKTPTGNASVTTDLTNFELSVYRFPTTAQQGLTPETVAWRVDANIVGANTSLGAVSSYADIQSASWSLSARPGSIAVGIACASGLASTIGATNCNSVGNEALGITFKAPAGEVRACASFTHEVGNSTNNSIYSAFQVVETSSTSAVVIQEGGRRVSSGAGDDFASNTKTKNNPIEVCGTFKFDSEGQKTLRVLHETNIGGTGFTLSQIDADGNANLGQRDIHWEVYPISHNVSMPVFVGPYAQMPASVKTSSYSLVPADEIVEFDTTSGALTATLFTAVGHKGKIVRIVKKNSGANLLTVATTSSQTIGTVTSTKIHGQGESIMLYSDGANWQWLSSPRRVEAARLNASTTPAIYHQSGTWASSLTRNGTGDYTLTFASGVFSAAPTCTCTGEVGVGDANWYLCMPTVAPTNSALRLYTRANGATAVDIMIPEVICEGPR